MGPPRPEKKKLRVAKTWLENNAVRCSYWGEEGGGKGGCIVFGEGDGFIDALRWRVKNKSPGDVAHACAGEGGRDQHNNGERKEGGKGPSHTHAQL